MISGPDEAGRAAYLAGLHAAKAFIFESTGKAIKSHKGVPTPGPTHTAVLIFEPALNTAPCGGYLIWAVGIGMDGFLAYRRFRRPK